jgi:hypothetical protein
MIYQEVQFNLVHSSLPLQNREAKIGERECPKERKKEEGQKDVRK